MSYVKIGFTGTRNGMTAAQKEAFLEWLEKERTDEFLHGACLGADEDACEIARDHVSLVVAYPGRSARGGANHDRSERALELSDVVHEEDTHFSRNRTIVRSCSHLVACPWQSPDQEPPEGQGGGTWYTIQYAVKQGTPVTVIWPDGSLEER